MHSLFASGHIAAFILALMLCEVVVLLATRGRAHNMKPSNYLPNILAGGFLLLAWSLSATSWPLAAAALTGALLAHLTDMKARWK
jgi:hypothetical protein